MVLESILTSKQAEKHPIFLVFYAIIASSIGLWTSYYIFPESSSIVSLAFLTVAFTPLIHHTLVHEEKEEASHEHKGLAKILFVRHLTIIQMFSWFFIGLIISYSLWYATMPQEAKSLVFKEQEKTLEGIRQLKEKTTGNAIGAKGPCTKNAFCWAELIFSNNATVLLLSILFSFVFGAGAVFLIAWQASVIGTLIGQNLIAIAGAQGSNTTIAYATGLITGMAGLAPHGIPEALGYFIGATAGGIISAAISKRKTSLHEIKIIAQDAIVLTIIAFALLLLGAWIEATAIAASIAP